MPPNLRIGLVQSAPNQPFYPGSAITGNVMLDVDEPKGYKQIVVHFTGRSHVHWTESRTEGSGNNQRRVTRSYTSNENYVDLVAPLWNSQQSPDGKLAPGQYSWPFTFNVPPNVPSSFEGTVGHIRFSLVATIVTGLLKFNTNVEVRIPVQQLVKITDPRLLQPVRQEVQKTVCCLCCASGPIVLTVAVPKTGFCVGDSFQLHTSLENGSNRRLTMITTIAQQIVYLAQGRRRSGGKTLISIGSDEIVPQASRNWDPSIEIPASGVEIIHETSCGNISITYTLNVVCRIPNALNLTASIPLQLGNCRDEQQVAVAAVVPGQPPPQQPGAAYPPPPPAAATGIQYQPPPTAAAYPPPLAAQATAPPPPAYGGGGGGVASNIGWSTDPVPVSTEEPLIDFSAQNIEKGIK